MGEKKMETQLQAAEGNEQQAVKAKLDDDQKVKQMEAKIQDEQLHEKEVLSKEKADSAKTKRILATEDKRLKKRLGSRQVAAALQKDLDAKVNELKKVIKQNKMTEKELEVAVDKNSKLQSKSNRFKHKLGHAKYRASMSKQKYLQILGEYKKLKLKHELLKQQNGASAKVELGSERAKAEMLENKYKMQVKVSQAADKEVELLKARSQLLYTRASRESMKASEYKQEREDEIANAKQVADSVRAKWSAKVIDEQVKHTKQLMKLKHKMEQYQLKMEQKLLASEKALDHEKRIASKEENKARNRKMKEKYVAELVG